MNNEVSFIDNIPDLSCEYHQTLQSQVGSHERENQYPVHMETVLLSVI